MRPAGAKAARCSARDGGGWPARARRWFQKVSIMSCMAGLGTSGLLERPGYRRAVSSATMSAAGCDFLASATPCPAHIESASISPVVPATGGVGS
jgi:hypothetical protein